MPATIAPRPQEAPSDYERKALLVLGMHRSGTSALTRVLGFCGGVLPRQDRSNIHASNPLGHWEPKRIVDIHDRFLEDAGTAWDAAFGYPSAMFESKAAAACRSSLLGVMRKEYREAPLFVLKDPRISRLMPLWRPVLSGLQATPHAVIVVRNPLEIAASLSRRDGWDECRALLVWVRYLLSAERDTRDLRRCFITYDRLIADWRSVVDTVSQRLDIAFPDREPATEMEIDRFVRQDLRHHRRTPAELLGRSDIADCLKQAFACFWSAANTGIVDCDALDAIAAELDEAESTFKRIRRKSDSASLHMISNAPAPPAKRDALLALVLAEFGRANDTAERSKRVLDEIMASRSWRFTRAFRVLGRSAGRLLTGSGKALPSR